MDKAELREAVEPYILLPDQNSDTFLAFNRILAKIHQENEVVIQKNFNFVVDHKKDLLETLLLSDKTQDTIKKFLTYPPSITKLFIRITTYLEVPNHIILNSFSDEWLIQYVANIKIFNQGLFYRLVNAFGKENLKEYLCYANTDDGEALRVVMVESTPDAIKTNFIASKFSHICDICDIKSTETNESHEKIFSFFEKQLQSTNIITEKISILENHSRAFRIKKHTAESLQINLIDIFSLREETRQYFKKICDAVDLIYMNDSTPLYKKETPHLNKGRLINGFDMICKVPGERDMFHNFIIKHSTSDTVKSLLMNLNSYISIYKNISQEVNKLNKHDICDYLLDLSIDVNNIDTTIKIEDIKIKNMGDVTSIYNVPKIWKILKIYEILQSHYEKNIGDQAAVKKLRDQVTFHKDRILQNESSDILDSFFYGINNHSHEDILSGFIQTNALLDSIPKKFEFYQTLKEFKGKNQTLIHIFNTCIDNKNTDILHTIFDTASTKNKNNIRQYLYSEYLGDNSNKNLLFFDIIRKFITDDLTHTLTLYSTLPVLRQYIDKNPHTYNNITQLRHQVSKRSIEEQNAFCHTIILLHGKGIIDVFFLLCENIGNHQKRKNIIGFYKAIDMYYKIGGSTSINITNELLTGIEEGKFPTIDLEELFGTIAEKINIPVDILMTITNDDILTKFIGKVLSDKSDIQNKKLGLFISEYIKDGCTGIRSNFYESELLKLFQGGETDNQNNQESTSQTFSITEIDNHNRPHFQHETFYTKHIDGITHKEQRHNIHNAFDELFDPDIYQDEYKPFMEKLYHQKRKAAIMDSLKNIYTENQYLENLSFLTSHISEIDTCLSSVKDNENDGQVYDNAIKKAQVLYQKIYKDILQTGNEQRAIRCEEYGSHLGLILHDGDIAKEESLRESMNLETTLTYDIVKILSHMRGCIGLHGWKTDTNLNYLLPNRFFIYSQNQESEKGVSDQIVVVLSSPTVGPIYVMDTLYGTRNLSVIMNHIHTLYNHITSHKQYVNTPIFIPPNVISSAGMNTNTLLSELQKYFPECIKTVTDLEVDTTRAGYKEFSTKGQGILIYQNP